jgi:tetratricopeptide (TPR) repeat protein
MPPGNPNLKEGAKDMPFDTEAAPMDVLSKVRSHLDKGEGKKALDLVDSFLKANTSSVANRPFMAKATVLKAESHLLLSDFTKAQESCEKAIALSKQAKDTLVEAEALRMIGNMCWKKGDLKLALEQLGKALETAQNLKDLRLEGKIRIDMATTLGHLGEQSSSEREFREAILALEKAGDTNELARAYNNLGNVILSERNFDRAAQMFAKSKKLCLRIGDMPNAAFAAMNRAECLIELDKAPEALEELEMARPIIEDSGDNYAIMGINNIFGIVYAKMKEYSRAQEHLVTARGLARQLSAPLSEAKVIVDIGRMHKWKGEKDKALQFFKDAKAIYEKAGAKRDIHFLLSEMNENV